MDVEWLDLPELQNFGTNLLRARLDRRYSQERLARECGLGQAQISLFEVGRRLPSLDQFIRLAHALRVPLQRLTVGSNRPGNKLRDLAVELGLLGAVDLWVFDAIVPGAARRPEEVIALAVSGRNPDPRVVETLPALLSWNKINPVILRAYGFATKTTYRLAWLADIALAIDRQKGFPGDCRRGPLERFLRAVSLPAEDASWDDLGRPSNDPATSPVWKRWKIRYGAATDDFQRRATELFSLREAPKGLPQPGRVCRRVRLKSLEGGTTVPTATPDKRKTTVSTRKLRKGEASGH